MHSEEKEKPAAPHKAPGPKSRFRVQSDAEGAPFPNLEVDATDEDNAVAQWKATNGAEFESAECHAVRIGAPIVRTLGR